MKNAHLRRYPHSSSLRRTSVYASLLEISDALHLDVFDQPAKQVFFSNLLLKTCRIDRYDLLPVNIPPAPLWQRGVGGIFHGHIVAETSTSKHYHDLSNCLCIPKIFMFKCFFGVLAVLALSQTENAGETLISSKA